ncbi:2'-5' RNA ligase [Clostridium saccharoperbutylacetonicum]|uniref:2'-5' RNA ligase n=1 Tax=Clostridium saccharoperbutylacetonicum N1-4(HMT) TaxID=931276 RepID=M1MM07_9CLOT|nr:2'-5' RNA ligase family protein [Clostridium saccharoperbutylacetonicum]AGF55791.1 2'-5' RNA ligase [Clostridium saccharoperbutylacetonicum N1-4(HMT)]NRT63476.1 2'-5' RNA ligase [Clostridium saccharoperbutylacetonicum]NSB26838.1 2'-5' RNA ligase [Clostridium saccharoperbutylacetonicum]NSB40320.1 2'-5' RNA ligase [Clostridium saccharoperbutylacetonicum]
MKDKFLCVMAQYDKETELKLKEIQKLLSDNGFVGKQTPNLPNHITIGSFDISQEELVKEKVKMVSKQFHSFDIKLNSIGLFGLDVLFIAPSVNHELLNLQQYFNNDYADGFGWTAHTTMLIDDHETIQKALPYLANNFKNFTGKIESISLYEFWPTRFILKEKLL